MSSGAELDDARRVKTTLKQRIEGRPWFRGIGIAPVEGGYAVRVNVAPGLDFDAKDLPATLEGVPLQVVRMDRYRPRA